MSRFEIDYNNKFLEETRRDLRRNMTKAEQLLWKQIRSEQIGGTKFRRQFSIGRFIVDFYACKIKLVVEVDGLTHITEEQLAYDKERQSALEEFGISFLRFKNEEIYCDIDLVIDRITARVKELSAL